MLYFVFQAVCESSIPGPHQGLTEEVIIPGKDYAAAEASARIILGERYRGATTVPATEVILVAIGG